jgi:hypothetical protein
MQAVLKYLRILWIPLSIIALYFLLSGIGFMPKGLNIFRKDKLMIDDTPVLVKEIRELGQLTTSEFYGEVYADINEVYKDIVENLKDSLVANQAVFYKNYSGLKDYQLRLNRYKSKEIEFETEKARLKEVLDDYKKKTEEFGPNEKKLIDEIAALNDDRKEKKQLNNRLEEIRKQYAQATEKFYEAQKNYQEALASFNRQKDDFAQYRKDRNLVYIGRGWVKAGIDLKKINEGDILVKGSDSLSIQIFVSNPEILDADINPWFIHTDEKKVKGFEIFIARTGSILAEQNFTDHEVTHLKKKCKDKLKQEAIKKGLLSNAKSSAVNTLESFFRLVGFHKVNVLFNKNQIVETTSN